jgi:mono/diheme cytochrome c family protein
MAAGIITAVVTSPSEPVLAVEESEATSSEASAASPGGLLLPIIDPAQGRRLFVSKGCVICHSINGVGGKTASALDACEAEPYVDIFDFVARMWRGSAAMIQFQSEELGYQMKLSGDELAHIVGFVYDIEEQKGFSDAEIPDLIRDWILDEPYEIWEVWPK